MTTKMVWIPRRHRSLVYKLLVLIPVAWITIAFLLYNGNSEQPQSQQLVQIQNEQPPNKEDIVDNISEASAAVTHLDNNKLADR